MSTRARGGVLERRARDLLIAQGYEVEKTRAGGRHSKRQDFWGAFDLIAAKPGSQRWIQVTVLSNVARHRKEVEEAAPILFGWDGAITLEIWGWPDRGLKRNRFIPSIFVAGVWRSAADYYDAERKDPVLAMHGVYLGPDVLPSPSPASPPAMVTPPSRRDYVDHPRRRSGKSSGRVAGGTRVFEFWCGVASGRCPFQATGFPTLKAADRAYEAHLRRSHGGSPP